MTKETFIYTLVLIIILVGIWYLIKPPVEPKQTSFGMEREKLLTQIEEYESKVIEQEELIIKYQNKIRLYEVRDDSLVSEFRRLKKLAYEREAAVFRLSADSTARLLTTLSDSIR